MVRLTTSLILLLCLLSACAHSPEAAPAPMVVMVSIDGARADYLDKYSPPHLLKLRTQGVSAQGLISVFPSMTFPNHYTLVTGLTTEHHGIMGNEFFDPVHNREYHVKDDHAVRDGTWYHGTPLWSALGIQGERSAAYFWPGSEAEIAGHRPDEYFAYDKNVADEKRVDKVLEWMRRPAVDRPRLINLYFSDVDTAGHQFGPDSYEVKQALLKVDEQIGRLMQETAQLPYPVNLIIVSDHGMEATDPQARGIRLNGLFRQKDFKIEGTGPIMFLYAQTKTATADNYSNLKKAEKHFHVYRKKDIPEKFHFKNNPSAPDLLLVADLGYVMGFRADLQKWHAGGAHGYDPKEKDMYGIFLARGPAFGTNVTLPLIENINVAPLILKVLNLNQVPEVDGTPDPFLPALR